MNILLHPTLGVNARLTFCIRCGGDGEGLVMLGNRNYVDICTNEACGLHHFGGADRRGECNKCGTCTTRRELTDREKVPSTDLCKKCSDMQKECDEAVAAGGVYWKCEGCGSEGAVKAEAPLAVEVRAGNPEHDGKPLGILIGECPICRPTAEEG